MNRSNSFDVVAALMDESGIEGFGDGQLFDWLRSDSARACDNPNLDDVLRICVTSMELARRFLQQKSDQTTVNVICFACRKSQCQCERTL